MEGEERGMEMMMWKNSQRLRSCQQDGCGYGWSQELSDQHKARDSDSAAQIHAGDLCPEWRSSSKKPVNCVLTSP